MISLPDYNAMNDADFRHTVRSFVEENYPDIPRHALSRLHWEEVKPWYLILSKHGWICPTWPREHGGMGLTAGKHLILIEEFERYGCARVNDIGPVMLGPLFLKYGTGAQKAFFLPKILSGEHIWAQGYSEPGAGSDLAAVRCEAVLDGGEWVINGQKTWTTLGMDANWIFILVRTDKTVRKQAGISFLLVPMDAPGVTIRNIENLELEAEFCEVFFDDVRVPADHILGEINQGWTAAKALLGHERVFIGAPRLSASAMSRLKRIALRAGVWDDPVFRDRYVALHCDVLDLTDLFEIYVDKLRGGEDIGADVAMLKIFQSELYQRISELMMEVAEEDSGLRHPPEGDRQLHAAATYLSARPTTIFGGSTEIMRNVLAKAVLNLPS
ncbi:acyl-CoA dehydrogenase family protein [uncultured Roseibium sp.]|uniref:acyl-CoA dehydrogenase family protein n=1 Tax=uncultured Roseibium sp. TaxID=1936171 RepID=UPI002622C75C|nr:acyl-CoA dehydrogenase family protein [uncultured Roseibium sp.]